MFTSRDHLNRTIKNILRIPIDDRVVQSAARMRSVDRIQYFSRAPDGRERELQQLFVVHTVSVRARQTDGTTAKLVINLWKTRERTISDVRRTFSRTVLRFVTLVRTRLQTHVPARTRVRRNAARGFVKRVESFFFFFSFTHAILFYTDHIDVYRRNIFFALPCTRRRHDSTIISGYRVNECIEV